MNFDKLSSEEVPQKFIEWLLKMGCPSEKVPSLEKITDMCRGQFYLVWRSLIEHVHPKDIIRHKRLLVFCDDIKLYEKNLMKKCNDTTVIPEQLQLWKEQVDLRKNVVQAESKVNKLKNALKELSDKTSKKLIQRNTSQCALQDLQRRIWLLRKAMEELSKIKSNLEDARGIAKTMKLDTSSHATPDYLKKCLSKVMKEMSLPVATVAASQDRSNKIEMIMDGVKGNGEGMWQLLNEERAEGIRKMRAHLARPSVHQTLSVSPYSVIAMTSALHATLAIEVMKNREHISNTRAQIAAALDKINHTLPNQSCELLVMQSELVHLQHRVLTMKSVLRDMEEHRGVFSTGRSEVHDPKITVMKIIDLDKNIVEKKEDIKKCLNSLLSLEKKIQHLRNTVLHIIQSFQCIGTVQRLPCPGLKLDLPDEPVGNLCSYFREKRKMAVARSDVSMDLDVSSSYEYPTDSGDMTFVDELKMYLRNFSLEKNRKLVLDNGEKIWIFETLKSSLSRLHSQWLQNNLPVLICPSTDLPRSVRRILEEVNERDALKKMAKDMSKDDNFNISDIVIKSITDAEEKVFDGIKKQNAENIQRLVKVNKALDISQENLQFWSENQIRRYISPGRAVNGRSYREYETAYLDDV